MHNKFCLSTGSHSSCKSNTTHRKQHARRFLGVGSQVGCLPGVGTHAVQPAANGTAAAQQVRGQYTGMSVQRAGQQWPQSGKPTAHLQLRLMVGCCCCCWLMTKASLLCTPCTTSEVLSQRSAGICCEELVTCCALEASRVPKFHCRIFPEQMLVGYAVHMLTLVPDKLTNKGPAGA